MKKLISVLLLLALVCALASCGSTKDTLKEVNVFVLTGPTGIGAVHMWDKSDAGKTDLTYHFTAVGAPDEIAAKLSSGEADIAAISTNLAAKLYQKTDGKIRVLAVNTRGVLSVLDNTGAAITSLADLKGRSVVTTGQGSNPQFILEYLLRENGLDPETDVKITYKTEGTELAAVWSSEADAVIVAPSPVSASILSKYEGSKKVLDLTEEWEKCSPDSSLMMGCIAARTEFCEQHPDAVKQFLAEYEASILAVEEDPAKTGELCETYGIVAKAAVAVKALPDCHICFVTGEEMKEGLTGYLRVLYDADPASVGGMPDENFWYRP